MWHPRARDHRWASMRNSDSRDDGYRRSPYTIRFCGTVPRRARRGRQSPATQRCGCNTIWRAIAFASTACRYPATSTRDWISTAATISLVSDCIVNCKQQCDCPQSHQPPMRSECDHYKLRFKQPLQCVEEDQGGISGRKNLTITSCRHSRATLQYQSVAVQHRFGDRRRRARWTA